MFGWRKRFSLLWAGAALALAAAGAGAQGLPPNLAAVWKQTGLPEGALSLTVQEVGGPRLMAVNADMPRNPASVMKLVTTWAALSSLGPGYVWRTELLTEPGARVDASGTLSGRLYLRAGGDPQFMLQDLWTLLRDLRLRGVKRISELVIDRSIFGQVATDPGAFDGAPDRAYNASPDAFMVGFGAERLMFLPDPAARTWRALIDPPLPGVSLEGGLQWTAARCPGSPEVGTEPVITSQGVTIRLSGSVPGACGEFSLYRLALSQPEHAKAVLQQLWNELGGELAAGQVRQGVAPIDGVRLAVHESPTLGEVIRQINKRSNNVMARTLLLTVGAELGARPATVQSSDRVVRSVLSEQGLPMPELVLDNGAGLSREASVSARSLAALLLQAWRSPYMPEFMSSLAISGVDGTVRKRLHGEAQGMAHLKTGSLRDVRSLAGYVLGASGKRYVVVSIVNHEQAGSVRPFNDALVAWLAAR
jgi:D-alanyl-D-alanine carboxypeptidase/D-alanyl-D-alanine-endopeptidase (penicillin-binding protein 4)